MIHEKIASTIFARVSMDIDDRYVFVTKDMKCPDSLVTRGHYEILGY